MKRFWFGNILGVCLLMSGVSVNAQDKGNPPKDEAKSSPVATVGPQMKVQIVIAEYEKEKKVESLPYTLIVEAGDRGKLRVGSRVPVATTSARTSSAVEFQYIDIGTNIDCAVLPVQDGKFRLRLGFERSWVEGTAGTGVEKMAGGVKEHPELVFGQPIIHQEKVEDTFAMREGQTLEVFLAADPLNGRLVKLEVTLNILK